jgi:hypothetical protein
MATDRAGRGSACSPAPASSPPPADAASSTSPTTISPALDLDASDEAWVWLYDGRIDTRRALLRVEPRTVSLTHASTRVTWTIRPVVFLPLTHRQGVELPACACDFTPHATD